MDQNRRDNRWCLICRPKNRTLYWHTDADSKEIWCFCNKCDRGYSLKDYCYKAGVDPKDFLQGDFQYEEAKPNEVTVQQWPSRFIPLSDPRSQPGVDYVKSRGLTLDGDMYYDIDRNGIVFPYYFDNHFCGAQTRFIVPRKLEDGEEQKVDTLPGTRLGLLFYGWNQGRFMGNVKGVVVTEGAFNALSITQALNVAYGGISRNPWRAIACSGSGATEHQKEAIKELKEQGLKIVIAPDFDAAGSKMLKKYLEAECATHMALTLDPEKDWNDKMRQLGHKEFAKYFISSITSVADVSKK
jgi:hypothetical protein